VAEVPSHRLKQAKRALRRAVVDRRDSTPPAVRAAWSRRIGERVLALPEVLGAGTVMAFWSFGSEVEMATVIERLHEGGARVTLPRVEGDDVAAVVYRPGDEVAPARFGEMEPVGLEVVPPAEVDLVLAPGVAFDRGGGRVGYGGGFYDRFLPRTRRGVPVVAVAFALQVVDEVPRGGADRPVDVIVTQDEVIRCRTG
jgi:5-formyltetrahydrofolate cyclo-ligase